MFYWLTELFCKHQWEEVYHHYSGGLRITEYQCKECKSTKWKTL